MIGLAMWARSILRLLRARLLHATGCLWWAKRQLQGRGAVMVLGFHRVLEDAEFRNTYSLPGMVIRRETFEQIAAYVSGRYETVDFARAAGTPAGKLRMLFTFDDGWRDNYTNALPVARNYGIPLTIFICPGLLGRTLPFWPERVAAMLRNASPPVAAIRIESMIETLKTYTPERRQKAVTELSGAHKTNAVNGYNGDRTLTWNDVREMDAAGVTFGCHTQTHQILTTVPVKVAREEICNSKRALEAGLYKRCDLFAYPNGNCSSATQGILVEEGFTAALTTHRGAWMSDTNPLAIPRINVGESNVVGLTGRFSPEMFQYAVFWKAWRAMKAERRMPVRSRSKSVLSEI